MKKERFFLYDITTGDTELDLGVMTQSEAENYEDGSLRAVSESQLLIDKVLVQIQKDIRDGDLTAIEELLRFTPVENLEGYLPEKL